MISIRAVLATLSRSGVRFVVVGGVAMQLQGSSYLTEDLDIAFERTLKNIGRIAEALSPLHPRPREFPLNVPFVFDEQTIFSSRILTLETDLGDIDLLGEIPGLGNYAAVEEASEVIELDEMSIRILTLDGLIRAKRALSREKDRAAVIELEAIREARDGSL